MTKNNQVPKAQDGTRDMLVVAEKAIHCAVIVCSDRRSKHGTCGVRVRFTTVDAEIESLALRIYLSEHRINSGVKYRAEQLSIYYANRVV
ncbi:MAG: hypothetical protein ABSB86_01445 [Bryobacteraceae bacterium]|jgi:hypothetical protein